MDSNQLNDILTGAVYSLLQILIPVAGAIFTAYKTRLIDLIKSKINTIQDEQARNATNKAFEILDTLLESSIVMVEQTTKKDILQSAEGKEAIDKALKQMGMDVVSGVKNQLSSDSRKTLELEINNLEEFIYNRMEKMLAEMKLNPEVPVSKTVVVEPVQEVTVPVEEQPVPVDNTVQAPTEETVTTQE